MACETLKPSMRSSPCIRGAPHRRLSRAILLISWRTSLHLFPPMAQLFPGIDMSKCVVSADSHVTEPLGTYVDRCPIERSPG